MKLFTLRHSFEARDHADIYATLKDFRRFGAVHPLMKSVTLVASTTDGVSTYDVREEVKLGGWLPAKPHYLVHVHESIAGEKILMTSRINAILRLRIQLSFSIAADGKIDLVEQVEVSRVPILTRMFVKIFTEAHTTAFINLRNQLSGKSILVVH